MSDPDSMDKVTCIINPRAANSRWARHRFLRAYLKKKLPGSVRDISGDPLTTVEGAREACGDSSIVVAMGGDGTIGDVLRGIFESGREKEVVFAVIPFGTGNAFRKALGIPLNPVRAIDGLESGIPRWIDLMQVEGRIGAIASIGATAEVTGEKTRSGIQGFLGFSAAARKLYSSPREEKEITLIDGFDGEGPFSRKKIKSSFFDCVIAKTGYFGYGWNVAPKALLDDGFLDITLFEMGSLLYSVFFPWIYLGIFRRGIRNFKAREVVVAGRNLPVQHQGEYLDRFERVEARVLPHAIRVMCPPTKAGRKRFVRQDG